MQKNRAKDVKNTLKIGKNPLKKGEKRRWKTRKIPKYRDHVSCARVPHRVEHQLKRRGRG